MEQFKYTVYPHIVDRTISCFYPQIYVPLCNTVHIRWFLSSIRSSFLLHAVSLGKDIRILWKGKNRAE